MTSIMQTNEQDYNNTSNINYVLCFILTKQLLCSVNIYMWQGIMFTENQH